MNIIYTKSDLDRCSEFANSIDTGYYASRAQFNNEKRIKDQVVGKLAEIVAYKYLQAINIDVSYPDFQIYDKKRKSWNFDMKSKDYNFHIKGQNVVQGARYGISWIFQDNDKHIFREYSDKDYVCFISIDLDNKIGKIQGIPSIAELHRLTLFKAPKLDYLKSKRAVYLDDLSLCKDALLIQAPALPTTMIK